MKASVRLHREWNLEKHLRHIEGEGWVTMQDPDGMVFPKIKGKHGVRDRKNDGTYIGSDFICMYPGSKFPLHTHEGDHEIYFIEGNGFVHINGEDIAVRAGHTIHIPAEYPHGVWVEDNASGPLVFAAAGHPHIHVDSHKRMQTITSEEARKSAKFYGFWLFFALFLFMLTSWSFALYIKSLSSW